MPGPTDMRATARRRSPAAIDRQRNEYLRVIRQARLLGQDSNTLLDKAGSLLTAHWGHATWASRDTILKTVDWLLRVAINNPLPSLPVRLRNAGAREPEAGARKRDARP